MHLSANYPTHSAGFSGDMVLGPLTDRRISFYQKRGRLGLRPPEPKRKSKRSALAELIRKLNI